ncbi:MAG: hypothetical protein SGARI_004882, partial [Bacillariaceae sp.]
MSPRPEQHDGVEIDKKKAGDNGMEVSLNDHHNVDDDANEDANDEDNLPETAMDVSKASAISTNTKSSFFLLNQKNGRNIPQVKIELENLTYQPITSTANAKLATDRKGCCSKKADAERTIVLDKVTTQINPYQLTAWMGPSGSGKTSLTSVVAGLITDPSDISSESVMKVNGSVGRLPKQMVGVVWQDDLLLSNLTVEETIYFCARLKTPADDTSDAQVKQLVEEAMNELNLTHIRDNLIGSPTTSMPGISGGERKRVAVAAELVVRPSLLVLDEPTSGLDATTAYSLMTTLKDLTSLGHSIAVVIHQPRTDIFKLIDHLLLLSKGR